MRLVTYNLGGERIWGVKGRLAERYSGVPLPTRNMHSIMAAEKKFSSTLVAICWTGFVMVLLSRSNPVHISMKKIIKNCLPKFSDIMNIS